MSLLASFFAFHLFVSGLGEKFQTRNDGLVMVHVLFRHGDRTNTYWTMYPKDPYINETYQPYGIGKLTDKGKVRMLNVGKELRETYGTLINDQFDPNLVYAQSTDVNRTKVSLELVMEGLFQTKAKLPYQFSPLKHDPILAGDFNPAYEQQYQKYVQSSLHKSRLQKYRSLFEYFTEKTGKKVRTFQDVQMIYICLRSEEEWGLTLPDWTKSFWPEPIFKLAILGYQEQVANDPLKTHASGRLLQKIISDSLKPKGRRMFLYSGHEHNLAHILITLGVFNTHNPHYGSYIAFEVYQIEGELSIKILYKDGAEEAARTLKLPNCDVLCTFDDFVRLQEHILPKSDPILSATAKKEQPFNRFTILFFVVFLCVSNKYGWG